MQINIEAVAFYLILIDSVAANLVAWFGEQWYSKHFRTFSRYFPMAKGWAAYYFVLVLWIGWVLSRLGVV